MVYLFFGENDFLIKEELEGLKRKFDPTLLAANFARLDGEKLIPTELNELINTIPFLSPQRLIVVYNLLERFEGGKEPFEPWLKVIREKPPTSLLVLISGKLSKENPALNLLKPIAQIKEFPLLKGVQLESWLRQKISLRGGKIAPQALRLLIQMVGEDQWRLSGEIEKLSLYTQGRIIKEQDIVDLVSPSTEVSILRLIDGWIEGKAQGEELARLLAGGEKPAHIIALLTKQLGRITRAQELLSRGLNRQEIQKRLELSDYPLEKTLRQCQKLTPPRLQEIYSFLLEIDLAVKTGKLAEEISLDILQAELLSPA